MKVVLIAAYWANQNNSLTLNSINIMKLKITTLVIVEDGEVQDIYHSLEDNQDKAYQEIIEQVNAEYGDGGVLQFYSLQGIKEYFEIVHIETQELTSVGFKTAIQC